MPLRIPTRPPTLLINQRPESPAPRIKSGMPPVRVLGVDPSLTNTGVALLERGRVLDVLVLTTGAGDDEAIRLHHLHMALARIIATYRPAEVAMEEFVAFYGKVNPHAMFLLKAAQSVCQLAVMEAGVPLRRYAPKVWKPKGDDKKATIALMQAKYGIVTENDNACDAVAIADYHLRVGRIQKPAVTPLDAPQPSRARVSLTVTRPAARVAHGELLLDVPVQE